MSFKKILASMGETGELGENPHASLLSGRATKGRIRPDMGDAGEQIAQNRPESPGPKPAPIKENRPIRPIRPDEAEIIRLASVEAHTLIERLCVAWACPPTEFEELRRLHGDGKLTLDYLRVLIADAPPNRRDGGE